MLYWLASYPKSGNTWCRAFLSNLARQPGDGPADINRLSAPPTPVDRDAFDTYLDFPSSDMSTDEIDILRRELYRQLAQDARSPLVMKLHCAFRIAADGLPIFPPEVTAGVVLIVRNPMDVAVSLSHFLGLDFDQAIDWMARDTAELSGQRVGTTPSLPQRVMSWSSHTRTWLNQSGMRVHLVKYEDMLGAPEATFTALVRFLGLTADASTISEAIHLSRFEELQSQERTQGCHLRPANAKRFFRNGRVGEGLEVLSAAQVARLRMTHNRTMAQLGYLGSE